MKRSMKHLYAIGLIALLSISCADRSEQEKHLFILSGQSNMVGLNPNTSFTSVVTAEFGKENIIVVKDSLGGQPIRRWYKRQKQEEGNDAERSGDLYDRLMTKGSRKNNFTFLMDKSSSSNLALECIVLKRSVSFAGPISSCL